MIRTPPIFGAMKFFAKQAMVSTAEKAGIDWTAHVQRMQQEAEVGTANCSCMSLSPCQQQRPTPCPPSLPHVHTGSCGACLLGRAGTGRLPFGIARPQQLHHQQLLRVLHKPARTVCICFAACCFIPHLVCTHHPQHAPLPAPSPLTLAAGAATAGV
jgi:hypothetical protein